MIDYIRNIILDWLFDFFCGGCEFCIRKFSECYKKENKKLSELRFWNKIGKWFNKMERLVLDMRYEKAL